MRPCALTAHSNWVCMKGHFCPVNVMDTVCVTLTYHWLYRLIKFGYWNITYVQCVQIQICS